MAPSELVSGKSIDPFSREVLEFAAVRELLRGYLSGPISTPLLDALTPHTNLSRIRRDLDLVRETVDYLRESPRPGLGGLRDPRPLLDKLRIEGVQLEALESLTVVEATRDLGWRQLRRLSPLRNATPCRAGDVTGWFSSLGPGRRWPLR